MWALRRPPASGLPSGGCLTLKKLQFSLPLIVFLCAAAALPAQTLSVDKNSLSFTSQVGGPAQTQTVTISTSSGSPTFTTFTNASWLTVSPTSGTVPSPLTVRADPTGLASFPIPYQGTLSIFGPNNQRVDVQVSLTIGAVGVSPSSVTFTYQLGAGVPPAQTLTLTGQGTTFNASATTTSGGNWLSVSPSVGAVPGTVSVFLNPATLASLGAGTYSGTVTISNGLGAPINVQTTLTISPTPAVTVSPGSVSLFYQIGGSNNSAQQTITLSTNSGTQGVLFTFSNTVENNPSGGIWYTVSPSTGGTIPANGNTQVTFAYNGANLPAGTYRGTATLNTPGGTPPQTQIPVTLTVSQFPLLTASAGALNFNYQVATPAPAAQNLTIGSTAGATALTLSATTEGNSGNWLSVPATATAGVAFQVTVLPTSLPPGTYRGAIAASAPGAANSPLQVIVNLKVTNDPVVIAVANGCSTAFLSCPLTFASQIGQSPAPSQLIRVTSSTSASLSYTATASSTTCGGTWLFAGGGTAGATDGVFSVAVNPAGVAAGSQCTGTIAITATNPATNAATPNSPLNLNVTMYVSNSALVVVTPNALTFNTQVNGSTPPQQLIQVTSTSLTDQLTYTVTPATDSGGNWLFVNSLGGTTTPLGGGIGISAFPGLLSPGTYIGKVTITAKLAGVEVADSPITIPVIFQVNAGTIAADKASLNFSQLAGGSAPASQTVNVTGSPAPINFAVSTSTDDGGSWLTATASGTATPAAVTVQANAGSLKVGTYNGKVTITAATPPGASGSPITISVTLNVVTAQTLTASPNAVTFAYTLGQAAPANQTVALSSTGGASPFTVSVPSSANWLAVTPASGTTPGNLTFAINTQGLTTAGKLTADVTVNSLASLSPAKVSVTLNVSNAVPPVLTAIANAASYTPGAVSPGENVVIGGTLLGPDTLAGAQLNPNGTLATTVSDTQVTFDNVPAPIIYVSAKQTSVMVPYEVAGRPTTAVRVTYKGVTSDPFTYNVAAAVPGIYTQNSQGNGPGSILNQDLTLNGISNRAAPNSVVAVYMTGEGVTTPNSITGSVAGSGGNGLNVPRLPVTATVAGIPATVEYYGSAPGIVYGVMQVNVRIPLNAPSGAQPLVIGVGTNPTQTGVTVAVR